MLFPSLFNWLYSRAKSQSPRHTARDAYRRRQSRRLFLETLEDRRVLAFLAPVSYAAGPGLGEMVSGDFNNDTVLDFAVANSRDSTVSVFLGNADGTFQPAVTSASAASSFSLAVGDFNDDGNLDIATNDDYAVRVLLGNGNGAFQAIPVITYLGSNPGSVAVGDFNADGKLDLGVLSAYGGDYYSNASLYANVLLGNGDGSFSAPSITGLGGASSAAVADFNGDGKLDFATAWHDGTYYEAVSVLLGDGLGNLQPPTDFSTGGLPGSVVAGDVNGDGHIDLVTANSNGKNISVLLGDGLGSFGSAQIYATGGYPGSVVIGDFNRDGQVDLILITTPYPYTNNNVTVLLGIDGGAFSAPRDFPAGVNPSAVVAGDFNGDGWLDAATTNSSSDLLSVLINDTQWVPAAAPSITVNDVTVTEGNASTVSATFTVSLSAAYGQPVTVHYATADGSATAGSDYQAASGTLTFAPGETSKTISVAAIGDRLPEPTETFVVNLSNPTNSVIADGQGVGTIVDDEPRISISDVTKREGRKNSTLFTFTITLSAAYDQPVTMSFRTVDGTATTGDNDYIAKSGTLTFAPGETTKTITIEVKGDNKKEANETFYLDLFGNSSNSLFTKNRGIGTILNDD